MERDARKMRGDGPFIFTQVTNGVGVEDVVSQIITAWQKALEPTEPQTRVQVPADRARTSD